MPSPLSKPYSLVVIAFSCVALLFAEVIVFSGPPSTPSNDHFANAQIISGSSGSRSDVNIGATRETGEPNHVGTRGGASVWYRWQAPFSGPVNFTSFGSSFDTLLAAYTGNSVAALTPVTNGGNDDNTNTDNAEGHTLTSSITFNAVAGAIYYIAIDGSEGRTGSIQLGWGPEASIAGQVSVSGYTVTVRLGGDDSRAVVFTNGVGNYVFQHLRVGGNYSVRAYPTRIPGRNGPCVLFEPPLTFDPLANNVADVNFIHDGCLSVGGTSISGVVRRVSGVGLPGVSVSITGTINKTVVTDPAGFFNASDLPVDGTYTVTPASQFFLLTPASRTFTRAPDILGADFVAGDSFEISGQSRNSDGAALSDVAVTLGGTPARTTQTDTQGYYSFLVPGGGTYSLTAIKSGVSFAQPTLTLSNVSANNKNIDFVAASLTISGRLRNVNQRGLSGITVNLTGSASSSTQTNANGDYSFTVQSGGSYDVAPSDGRVSAWLPSDSRSYNNLSQNVSDADFVARFPTFTVTGIVKNSSGTPFPGVKVRLTGTNLTTKDYTTNSSGSYTSDPLNVLGDYTFTPQEFVSSGTTFNSFNPANKTFTSILTCSPSAGQSCSGFDYLGIDFTASPAAVVAPSNLVYSTNPAVYTKGTAITPNTPTNSGGAVVSYSINQALPAGLNFSTTTGVISGTPTVVSATTNYTVTATNSGGSTNANVSIQVTDLEPANLTYSTNPAVYTKGTAITPNVPSSSGGAVVSYFITPLLPAGLSINSSTGIISGTPTVVWGTTIHTVVANNSAGGTEASLSIRVNDAAPAGPTIFTEEGTNRAIAIDSVNQLRGPFRVLTPFNFSSDRHTRVMLFTSNFTRNAGDALTVTLQGNLLPIESVGTLPGVNPGSFIVVRLVDQLLPGDLALVVTLRGLTSNTATITISL